MCKKYWGLFLLSYIIFLGVFDYNLKLKFGTVGRFFRKMRNNWLWQILKILHNLCKGSGFALDLHGYNYERICLLIKSCFFHWLNLRRFRFTSFCDRWLFTIPILSNLKKPNWGELSQSPFQFLSGGVGTLLCTLFHFRPQQLWRELLSRVWSRCKVEEVSVLQLSSWS